MKLLYFFDNKENYTRSHTHTLKTLTYTHTYVHTYIRKYIHTYTHTCVHTHTYIHSLTLTHRYIHAYIHTHIHVYIHTYIHTNITKKSFTQSINLVISTGVDYKMFIRCTPMCPCTICYTPGRKEENVLFNCYMTSDILWEKTIQMAREETHCRQNTHSD